MTKTGKTFIQVFIESETDLPKETGDYILKEKFGTCTNQFSFNPLSEYDKDYFTRKVDWYLIEQKSLDVPTEEEIEKRFPSLYSGFGRRKNSYNELNINAQDVAKWAISEIKKRNEIY